MTGAMARNQRFLNVKVVASTFDFNQTEGKWSCLLADVIGCKDHENFERQCLNEQMNIFKIDKPIIEITNIMSSLVVYSFDSICDKFFPHIINVF